MSHGFKQFMRKGLDRRNRMRLANPNPTVFASNCNGGVLTHDLGLQFKSPTVNLFIRPKEYVKFLGNLHHYLYEARFVAGGGVLTTLSASSMTSESTSCTTRVLTRPLRSGIQGWAESILTMPFTS